MEEVVKMKLVILPVILLVLVFVVSCATKETLVLENITISTDSHPEFVLKNTDNLSEEQLKKDEKIASALNKALTDYPELSTMLEADMIDGGSNSYIYEGSEPFFKTLNEFTDENFKKAISMFTDITEDEFIYNAAIGYGISNEEKLMFEIPEEPLTERVKETKIVKSSFDEMMVWGFWSTFFNRQDIPIAKANMSEYECSLDQILDLEVYTIVQFLFNKELVNLLRNKSITINYIQNLVFHYDSMLESFNRIGLNIDYQYTSNRFEQIMFSSMMLSMIIKGYNSVISLGHLLYSQLNYLLMINKADYIFSLGEMDMVIVDVMKTFIGNEGKINISLLSDWHSVHGVDYTYQFDDFRQ